MAHIKGYECTICNSQYEGNENLHTCPKCGQKGILEIIYDYNKIKHSLTKAYLANCTDNSLWRYSSLISVDPGRRQKFLHVGNTPLYRARRLDKILGFKKLYIKDEGMNPTASLKDRASVVAVADAFNMKANTICCSSTGNAASSLAGNAARVGINTVIFVPKRAPVGKLAQLLVFGAKVIVVEGNYRDAFEMSQKAIEKWGWYNRNAAINPHLVEGKKTVALSIAEQMNWNLPDWVVVSVGDGCTIAGVYKGFYDLVQLGITDRIPKLLGVQSDGCCPFVNAHIKNESLKPTEENTIADSISVGVPRNPVKAMKAVEKSGGSWIAVSDHNILKAMKVLGSNEGVFTEPAGAASLAGAEEALKIGIIKPEESVCIIATGNGLKDTKNAMEAAGKPIYIEPDINELIKVIGDTL
ncbi:MAG: threonine synthase [Clostridiales bacterium]|nr:threonine synthase [Clostridiales bacterium]